MTRNAFVVCIALLVGVGFVPAPTAGSSHFDVALSPSMDVPDRGVTFDGQEHLVTETGRIQPGTPIYASVDVDDSTPAALQLLDEDHNVVDADEGRGDGELAFPTDGLEPGSYVVALRVDGEVVDLEPVVVSAYDVTVDAPDDAQAGSTIEVTADVTATGSASQPDRVRAVVGDDQERVRATLSHESGSTYAGAVDTSELSGGSYTVYVIAEDVEEVFQGEKAVLGASDPQTVELAGRTPTETTPAETTTSSGGGSSGGGSSGGGGGSSGGGSSGGASSGGSSGGGDVGATTQAGATTAGGSVPSTDDAAGTTAGASPPGGGAGTDGPATAGTTASTERTVDVVAASGGQPGFGVGIAVVALLAAATLAFRRR